MALKHNSRSRPAWVRTQDINCIQLYGSCYIDPLKFGTSVFSQAYMYIRHVGPTSIQHRISFDVATMRVQSFDMATGPVQTMPSCHALNFARGEYWAHGHLLGRLQYSINRVTIHYCCSYMYVHSNVYRVL